MHRIGQKANVNAGDRVRQMEEGGADSQRKAANSLVLAAASRHSAGFGHRWLTAVFTAFIALVWGGRCEAASVQIQAGSAQVFSHCVVRTSSGNIYAVILDTSATPTLRVYESTNGGSSWAQKDAAHAPSGANYTSPSAAIDGNGVIDIAYWDATSSRTGLRYVTFSTASNTFSGDTLVVAVSYAQLPAGSIHTSIAVDSNNVPHVMYEDGVSSHTNSTGEMLTYVDKVGGRWNRGVQLPDPSQLGAEKGEILIDQNNLPEISYTIGAIYSVNAGIGNANKATSFTTQAVASNFTGQPGIAMDNANNTWISYSTSSSGAFPMPAVVEHRTGDPWSTWQTPITDSVPNGSARTAALAINGSTLYIAYEAAWGPTSNVVWQSYNGSSWSTVASLDQPSATPVLKWSQYFNNGGSSQIDVIVANSTGAYWNKITNTISGISPSSALLGTSVSVTGSNFGSTQGTSSVSFNGIAPSVTSWGNTQIVALAPCSMTSGPVVVTVGGSPSNGVNFSTLQPVISSTSTNGASAGTSITINGLNFLQAPCSTSTTFNGVSSTPTSVTASQITVPVPVGAAPGPLAVTVGSLTSTPVPFTVFGAISGTVTAASNGNPISGASVQVLQSNTVIASVTTAGNGGYGVQNLPAGTYDVRFSASGYGTAITPGNSVIYGTSTTVNASLASPGTISGRVTQTDGVTAIAGASVTAARVSSAAGSATTDSNGNYSISTLAAGSYTALASAAGFVTQSSGGVSVTSGNSTTQNFSLPTGGGTQSVISYFYDESGRLIGASDSQGNTAGYSYDSAGNVLSISVNPSSQVSILGFDPIHGPVGTPVTISGTGFSSTASQDTVTFNGTTASVTSASSNQLVVTVPSGATTGVIRVVTPSGTATSSTSFAIP